MISQKTTPLILVLASCAWAGAPPVLGAEGDAVLPRAVVVLPLADLDAQELGRQGHPNVDPSRQAPRLDPAATKRAGGPSEHETNNAGGVGR